MYIHIYIYGGTTALAISSRYGALYLHNICTIKYVVDRLDLIFMVYFVVYIF